MSNLFSQVDKNLYRGGEPDYHDLIEFRDFYGIKRIVSLDDEVAKKIAPMVKSIGMEHVILPLTDGNGPNVDILAEKIIPMLMDGKPTYVHCYHGKDRTGMTIAMYRVATGWDVDRALEEAKNMTMGNGLSSDVAKSYYEAVREFADDIHDDISETNDIVQQSRFETSVSNNTPSANNQFDSEPNRTSFAPYEEDTADLTVIASVKVYTKTNNPIIPQAWYLNQNEIPTKGRLYGASISSGVNMIYDWRYPTKKAVEEMKWAGVDIAVFQKKIYIVFNPDALINIEEIDDVNDVPLVGAIDNYTGSERYVAPGSGGADTLTSGQAGAAGPVQLPYMFGL